LTRHGNNLSRYDGLIYLDGKKTLLASTIALENVEENQGRK